MNNEIKEITNCCGADASSVDGTNMGCMECGAVEVEMIPSPSSSQAIELLEQRDELLARLRGATETISGMLAHSRTLGDLDKQLLSEIVRFNNQAINKALGQ